MKEIISMWEHTKMVVLVAISAGLYAALLLPFKMIQIIPGFTEIRPAVCLPIVCSLFFGPAGAWGACIGNLVADFAGQFGPGSLFGLAGNFLYGYLPYRIWKKYKGNISKKVSRFKDFLLLIFIVVISSAVCSSVISWGLQLIGLPFYSVSWIILLNNLIFGISLVPVLLNWLDKRVNAWQLNYEEIMPKNSITDQRYSSIAIIILVCLLIASFIIGYIPVISKITGHFNEFAGLANDPVTAVLMMVLIIIFALLV